MLAAENAALSSDLRYDIASPHGVEHYITWEIDRPREVATIEQIISEYLKKALGISVNTLNKKLQRTGN